MTRPAASPTRRSLVVLGGAALAALSITGMSSFAAPKPRPPQVFTITFTDMKFGPAPADLHVGDTIEWANDDIFLHTATARDKSFDLVVKPKQRRKFVLAKAGEIAFYCRFHTGMKGTLVVAK